MYIGTDDANLTMEWLETLLSETVELYMTKLRQAFYLPSLKLLD